MSAAWAQVIATLMAPLVTISVAAVTALWTLKTWGADREVCKKVPNLVHLSDAPTPIEEYVATVA
jgi:hypothetical protein